MKTLKGSLEVPNQRSRLSRSTRRTLLSATLLSTGLVLTGCAGGAGGGLLGQLFSSLGGGGGFQPPGYTPFGGSGSGGLPGLNTPGGAGPRAPNSTLPPPAASSATAQKILQTYGIPVNGAGATPDIMNVIADGLRHYKPENLQGIQQINVLSSGGGSTAGMWYSNGNGAQIDLYAHAGWSQPVSLHTVTHELGHHWSLYANQQDGQAFLQALGSGPQGHVTPYSYNTEADQQAEAVAYLLIGNDRAEQPPLPQWNPSQAAIDVVQRSIVTGRPTI